MTKAEDRLARLETHLTRIREANHHAYVANASAAQSTAGWLLAASTATDSAGFYFAMNAASSLPSITAATLFLLALSSTFWCGVLVTRVNANDAAAADNLRRVEIETAQALFDSADEASDARDEADNALSMWAKLSIFAMLFGALCLILGKAIDLM